MNPIFIYFLINFKAVFFTTFSFLFFLHIQFNTHAIVVETSINIHFTLNLQIKEQIAINRFTKISLKSIVDNTDA